MLFALIPAAGQSTRMGQPKLALPLGNRTVIERVIDALTIANAETLVVLAPHVANLGQIAEAAGATVLQLPTATPDMRATIEAGLAFLSDRFQPSPSDVWLLCPADHPTLDPELIQRLHRQLQERPEFSIALPTFEDKRGHPAIIRWSHVAGIRDFPRGRGLNAYLRQFLAETLEVPVDSADVLLDLDTPEDYERLRKRFR
jgi:molybdenum cofactor cytidylyltransferase